MEDKIAKSLLLDHSCINCNKFISEIPEGKVVAHCSELWEAPPEFVCEKWEKKNSFYSEFASMRRLLNKRNV